MLPGKIDGRKKRSAAEKRIIWLRNQIKLHQALGITEYPAGEDLNRFFELTDKSTDKLSPAKAPARKDSTLSMPEPDGGENETKLGALRQEMITCTQCYLRKDRLGSVVGSGHTSCNFMVVGDWSQQKTNGYSGDILFGSEEDEMLRKMLAAIRLDAEAVYVTNCLKCCPGKESLPDRTCEGSCFSFLGREVALVKPLVICAMGEVAARLLTGSSEPLARMRGKFSKYRYKSESEILVMPTYHPRFLLRNTEMKKATWLDLQTIQRQLRTT